jgi:dipeptidyl aminopeptidase/acylaminoacyl peptidase
MLAALLAPNPVHAGTQPWTLDDILAMKVVSDPQVSPDGKWVAYVIQELKPDSSDYQSDLWLASVATGETRRLTAAPENDEAPRWSPDGKWIAFLSDRPRPGRKADEAADEGKRQIWLIRPDGGEATILSNSAGGASAEEWSADGRFLAFLAREPKSDEQKKKDKDRDDAWTPDSKLAWNRLWTIDVATRKATQLTRGAFHVSGFSIAPDGKRIAIAAQPTPRIPDSFQSDLYLVPVAGGPPVPLVQQKGEDADPSFSPDGRWVAFLSQDARNTEWWSNTYVCVINVAGGKPANLTENFDERVGGLTATGGPLWNPDGETLLFTAITRTDQRIFRAFADGRPVEPVMKATGVDASPSLDARGEVLVWTHEEATAPREVWTWDIERAGPHPLTKTNPQAAARLAFDKQVITWPGADGRQVEGLLLSPANARPGVKAPLLVNVHGGPAGTHVMSYSAGSRIYPYPLFLQSGWAVLLPNPRGSGGYGEAFRGSNVRDWGGKDYEDIMAGVDQLVKLGLVDEKRMAVCGWSYGGFMTSTIVTKTDRFKAAVVGAGVMDMGSMAGTCDIPEFNRSYFGAWPWEDPSLYVEHSALYHAGNVRTPTALIHGGAD